MELRQQLIISENKSILASVAGVQVSQKSLCSENFARRPERASTGSY